MGCIEHLQLVTVSNYNILAILQALGFSLQHTQSLLSSSSLVVAW
jgi:hypothetical protein